MIVLEPPSTGSGAAAFSSLRKPELARFLKAAQRALQLRGDVTLLLADDARIRELNRSFRGKNKTTDVLSFPAASNGEGVVGDLAISVPVAAAQAEAHGHSLGDELRILALHGLLHLAGYDHEADAGEMRAREAELRDQFKLPVSLIERALSAGKGKARRASAQVPGSAAPDAVKPVAAATRKKAAASEESGPKESGAGAPVRKSTVRAAAVAPATNARSRAAKSSAAKSPDRTAR